jgi:hypothetical protein
MANMAEQLRIGVLSRIKGWRSGEPPELVERRKRGIPIHVHYVGKDNAGNFVLNGKPVTAQPVGEERGVIHLALQDMAEHAINAVMTELILGKKLDANAVYINPEKSKMTGPITCVTIYQPLKINNS